MSEKLHVAYLVRPAEGGIKVHLLTLLSGLDRARFQPLVICPPGASLAREVTQLGVETLPLDIVGEISPRKDLRAVIRVRNLLRERRPDILHMHSSKAGLIGRLATIGLLRRPKLVLTEHAFIFDERTTGAKRTLIAWVERRLSRSTDRIVAVSEALKTALVAEQGITPTRITVIHNGVAFLPPANTPRSGCVVGTVSRLAPQKGVEHFIRAAGLVKQKFPQARFAIIGDGPYRQDLESLAESLGIGDVVEFLGFRSDAHSIIGTFSVFVLASIRETFGMTVVEALSQEIPVVGSRTGGIPEIIDGATTGLLAEPGSASDLAAQVCRLLEDPALARRLAQQGARWVRARFSSEVMVANLQNLYLELTGSPNR